MQAPTIQSAGTQKRVVEKALGRRPQLEEPNWCGKDQLDRMENIHMNGQQFFRKGCNSTIADELATAFPRGPGSLTTLFTR